MKSIIDKIYNLIYTKKYGICKICNGKLKKTNYNYKGNDYIDLACLNSNGRHFFKESMNGIVTFILYRDDCDLIVDHYDFKRIEYQYIDDNNTTNIINILPYFNTEELSFEEIKHSINLRLVFQ
jgi:hypothetical protein